MATNQLKLDTATALLEAIKEAAPDANRSSTEALESLARAYAAVVSASPKADVDRKATVF